SHPSPTLQPRPPIYTLFPYTTLFRSFIEGDLADSETTAETLARLRPEAVMHFAANALVDESMQNPSKYFRNNIANGLNLLDAMIDRKSTRLNSSHVAISYAVFCLKKK